MLTTGLLVRIEAKPEHIEELEARFKAAADLVREEGLAVGWFALRLGPTSYGIFDVFRNDADRDAHLAANGPALEAAAELFSEPLEISTSDVIASVLPGD